MGFQQGMSGLTAAAKNLDVIGNNIANANTVGFKSATAQFADVFAASMTAASPDAIGLGVKVAAAQAHFGQGNITSSSSPLDVAIDGGGFFRVEQNGAVTYSRNGQLHIDKDGYLVNVAGKGVTGYGVDASGGIVPATPTPLKIATSDLTPAVTGTAGIVANLDARDPVIGAAFDIANPATYSHATSLSVYDSLGNAHTLSTYYTKTAANTWAVNGALDGVALTPASLLGTITFKADGSIDTAITPSTFAVAATPGGGASPLAFTLDYTGTTQYGSNFGVTALQQDGYSSGKFSGFSINSDGKLEGRYTNGQTRVLGQVALASFANSEGLQALGGNEWASTAASGLEVVGTPGSGRLGVLQSGAVEESNVDLTQELVSMITAQRSYQANAQTIKTQDQVLATVVNLR